MSTKIVESFSPGQCRAARGLIDLTQSELAEKASLGLSTIVDFERSRRQISNEAIGAIRKALENLGLHFIDENGGGVGVRFKKPARATATKK
jgi:transcriptional regulator with XRE-family HTH domain